MTSISFRSRLQPWIWHSEPSQPPAPVALQYFSMIQKCQLKADSARLVYFFPANCNSISLFRRVTAVFAVVLEQAAAVRAIVRITPTLLRETNCGTGSYSNSRTTDYRNFTVHSTAPSTQQMIWLDFGATCCINLHFNVEKNYVFEATVTSPHAQEAKIIVHWLKSLLIICLNEQAN